LFSSSERAICPFYVANCKTRDLAILPFLLINYKETEFLSLK